MFQKKEKIKRRRRRAARPVFLFKKKRENTWRSLWMTSHTMNGLCPAWWLPRWWWNLSRLWREVYNNRTAGILPSERALFYFLFNCVWILRRLHHHRPLSSFSFMPILRLISMVLYNLILVQLLPAGFSLMAKLNSNFSGIAENLRTIESLQIT
jgi:hypothetical protein